MISCVEAVLAGHTWPRTALEMDRHCAVTGPAGTVAESTEPTDTHTQHSLGREVSQPSRSSASRMSFIGCRNSPGGRVSRGGMC